MASLSAEAEAMVQSEDTEGIRKILAESRRYVDLMDIDVDDHEE